MKKVKVLLVVLMLSLVFTACNRKEEVVAPESKQIKIGYVTDTNGLGDQAFNDAIYSGLESAADELNIKLTTIEPEDPAQIETGLRILARNGNEVIIAGSSALQDAVEVVANEFPYVIFVNFDGSLDSLDNVMSLKFKEQEAAYLVGAFAARMIEPGEKIGFIGGMDNVIIQKFEAGYVEGAIAAGMSESDILVSFTGAFNDPALGKQTADAQYTNGATFIFSAAGACNLGMFESAEQNGYAALGAATGQFDKSDTIIASHIKSVDTLGGNIIREYVENGTLPVGIVVNGLAESGVDIRFNPINEANGIEIPEEVKTYLEEIRSKIITGKIVVPESR